MTEFAVLFDPAKQQWIRFCHPVEVLEVTSLTEVVPALEYLEQRVEHMGLFAAGYVSYEAAPAFDPALKTKPPQSLPLLRFGLFAKPTACCLTQPKNNFAENLWSPQITQKAFSRAIQQIHQAIAAGETYQVNYTFPLLTDFAGDPWLFFQSLVFGQKADHAGYLSAGRWAICSASPELFFQRHGTLITMRPMKGTSARGRTLAEDRIRAEELFRSAKNRAENVMILDMVRNDLGRLAPPGEVKVENLYRVEKYPTVWQMTSTASAQTDANLAEVFTALFPCASITGAPKARTMQIIAELEHGPRQIYTGTFGWLGPGRVAHFSVAIRTALVDRQQQSATYGVGAGITWDSVGGDEYAECLAKSAVLNYPKAAIALIETLRWTPWHGYFLLAEHVDRLLASAAYFDIPVGENAVRDCLADLAGRLPRSPCKVRLLLNRDGSMDCQHTLIEPAMRDKPMRLQLALDPVDDRDIFLYHKTTHRKAYDQALARRPEAEEVLLWNQRREVTEFSVGNLVALLDGEWLTPPLTSGLLPGSYRSYLLKKQVIREQKLTIEDLPRCEKLFLVNAVRKWQRVVWG
ncbi:MAG: chorismate-binding protein [Deltaproteobacteria bacterium]|jgi:para-aminobenzoate synthetase/4-amino-4-deoxychorismate lyase|nr:chorismate-binding protein [Deltaproteobacteria bacterium]